MSSLRILLVIAVSHSSTTLAHKPERKGFHTFSKRARTAGFDAPESLECLYLRSGDMDAFKTPFHISLDLVTRSLTKGTGVIPLVYSRR